MDRATAVRRDQWAGTIFTTWVVLGLFLDGWAHNADRPDHFWTPWHAVLYSGFVAGAVWFALEQRRRRQQELEWSVDPYVIVGFVAFAVAGVGDAIWHTVFGVEEDVAALLSPTHLALMVGGVLLVTTPTRGARDIEEPERAWRTFAPVVWGVVLCVAVVAFFLQFVSAFHTTGAWASTPAEEAIGAVPVADVVGVLVTNVLLLGGVAWVLGRWPRPPAGTLTVLLAAPALLLSSMLVFEHGVLVLAPALGGVVGDVLVHRGGSRRTVLLTVPAVTWSTWFGFVVPGAAPGWEVELWTGAIVFTVLTGGALELLLRSSVWTGPGLVHDAPVREEPPALAR